MTLFFRRSGASPLACRLILVTCLLLVSLSGVSAAADALSGRVLDSSGRPVANALVLLDGPLGTISLSTDGDGRFVLPDSAPATYRLTVKAEGLVADAQTVRVPADSSQPLTVTLRVAPVSEAVIVSAAQVPTPLSESPATSTVVGRDEIQARQLETVADAIRTIPGFTVARNGGRGALTSVFPRGGESDYTLVMIDGLRANTFGGGFDFSLLPFGDVEQVEVIQGPQSALFGSDAIGGVVQLTTRRGGAPTGSASIEGGNQSTVHGVAGGAATFGQWSLGGGVEHFANDGFTGTAPADGEQVSNDDWHSTNVSGTVGWTASDFTAIRGTGRWLDADRGNPGPYGSNPIGAFPGVDTVARGFDTDKQGGISARLPWGHALAGRVEQRVDASVEDLDNKFQFKNFDGTTGGSILETHRATARAQTDIAATATTGVSAGIEYLGERVRSTYLTGEQGQQVPVERRNIGTFAEVRQDLGSQASLTAGVRVENIHRDALEGDPFAFTPRPAFADDSVTSFNPRLNVVASVWRDSHNTVRLKVHGSAGTGIRPPDAFEIGFTDNPSLKPERSRSVDAGVTTLVTSRLSVDATYFYNRYEDLIVAVGGSFTGASRFRTDNIANAQSKGLELGVDWRGTRGLNARAAYTFMPTEVLAVDGSTDAPSPFTVGDPLLRRPRHQGSLDLVWSAGHFSAFGEARARGTVLDVEPNFGTFGGLFTAPGFFVVDAGGSWRAHRSLEIFARGLNLLDRSYEEAYGYPALGRSGMIGVRVAVRP